MLRPRLVNSWQLSSVTTAATEQGTPHQCSLTGPGDTSNPPFGGHPSSGVGDRSAPRVGTNRTGDGLRDGWMAVVSLDDGLWSTQGLSYVCLLS